MYKQDNTGQQYGDCITSAHAFWAGHYWNIVSFAAVYMLKQMLKTGYDSAKIYRNYSMLGKADLKQTAEF